MGDSRVERTPRLDRLLAERGRFRAFLVSRLGSEADADELLQSSLLKAMQRAPAVRDDERLIAWFYQVLRHAMIDHVRSRRSASAREAAWLEQRDLEADDEARASLCSCVDTLIARLKPRERELVRRVELQGEPAAEVAKSIGLTSNHAGVVLHRARRHLRDALTTFCGDCAAGACLACDCPPSTR